MACNKYNKSCDDPDQQVQKIIITGHRVIRTVHCSFLVCVQLHTTICVKNSFTYSYPLHGFVCSYCLQVKCLSFVWKLTAWSRILLEKLTVPQLVKKLLALYVTQRFITTFTRAFHPSLSWTWSIQLMPHIPHLEDLF